MKNLWFILICLLSATLLHAADTQPCDREITHVEKEAKVWAYSTSVYEKCIKGYVFLITNEGGIVQVFEMDDNHHSMPTPMPCRK